MPEHMRRNSNTEDQAEAEQWLSAREIMEKLKVSRSQIHRLAIKHSWRRLDVSTGTRGNNQGVRYSRDSVDHFIHKHTF